MATATDETNVSEILVGLIEAARIIYPDEPDRDKAFNDTMRLFDRHREWLQVQGDTPFSLIGETPEETAEMLRVFRGDASTGTRGERSTRTRVTTVDQAMKAPLRRRPKASKPLTDRDMA